MNGPVSVRSRVGVALLAAGLLAAHVVLALAAASRLGVTTDEPVGIAGGYELLTRGEMRINFEHPPLVKVVAALPLLGFLPAIDPVDPDYAAGRQWPFARRLLFDSGVPVDAVLRRSRAAVMAFGLALAAAVLVVAVRIHGFAGGVLALAFHALDPAFLGHGPLVQFDVALSLWVFLGAFTWLGGLRSGSLLWFGAAGACLGLGMATKFTAVYLPFLWAALAVAERRPWRAARAAKALAVTAVAAIVTLTAGYGFVHGGDFVRGFAWQVEHARRGHLSYFLGQVRPAGSFLYFPVAFLLKTPLETLAALGLLAIAAVRAGLPRDAWRALLCAGVFVALLLPASINIGHRYMLPAYPFLAVALGSLGTRAASRPAGMALAALLLIRAAAQFPDYLGSTNLLAGREPERYLADSNVDWGQDLPRLARWLAARGTPEVALAYAGTDSPEHRGIRFRPAPCTRQPGLYAASINCLVGIQPPRSRGCVAWLRTEREVARIGTSIVVYDVPEAGGSRQP